MRAPQLLIVPSRIGEDPSEFRAALLNYWRQMHVVPTGVRLSSLVAIQRAEDDRSAARAMALFAIADYDSRVVFEATRRYLLPNTTHFLETRNYKVADALQWIGRRLVLRIEAVFAALLCLGNEAINAELLSRRSVTTSSTVRGVLAAARAVENELAQQFIADWQELEATPDHQSTGAN